MTLPEAIAEINKARCDIIDLRASLMLTAAELNDLMIVHWDMDDVQPEEREEIERLECVLNRAKGALGACQVTK